MVSIAGGSEVSLVENHSADHMIDFAYPNGHAIALLSRFDGRSAIGRGVSSNDS